MDTKTLVVGQKVLLESGVYCNAGTVVKVTPNGVDVQTSLLHGLQHELLHFDKNGQSPCLARLVRQKSIEFP